MGATLWKRPRYGARWEIVLFFRVRKHGGPTARRGLATDPPLRTAIASSLLSAWPMDTTPRMKRIDPDASCAVVLASRQWRTPYGMPFHRRPTAHRSPLREMVRSCTTGWFRSAHGRRQAGQPSHRAGFSPVARIDRRCSTAPRRQCVFDASSEERLALGGARVNSSKRQTCGVCLVRRRTRRSDKTDRGLRRVRAPPRCLLEIRTRWRSDERDQPVRILAAQGRR